MFYAIGEEKIEEISVQDIREDRLIAGYVSSEELEHIGASFGFAGSTIAACQSVNKHFRSGVEVYHDYTFTELRMINFAEDFKQEDCVALYIKRNFFLVVDISDEDGSTRHHFEAALTRYAPETASLEKLIYAFLDSLIVNDFKYIEDTGNEITELEEDVLNDYAPDDFNMELLHLKKELLMMHNYYEQLFDITDAIEENENEIFDNRNLMYIANLSNKIIRLREDTDSLGASVTHLQDAYSSFLDLKLNRTMKRFTVLTSVFFPLTIIVGWYGMNFRAMPEFAWKYGYLYVIVLSAVIVGSILWLSRKKKWF